MCQISDSSSNGSWDIVITSFHWSEKGDTSVRDLGNFSESFISQWHNLYKLKNISLEPVKIADYFKENNLFTLVSKNSKLNVKSSISKNITASRQNVADLKDIAYTFPDDAYKVL